VEELGLVGAHRTERAKPSSPSRANARGNASSVNRACRPESTPRNPGSRGVDLAVGPPVQLGKAGRDAVGHQDVDFEPGVE
jgi:hypothetical protein